MRRNYGCRITENIKIHNMNAIVLENEKLRMIILLDKGADIIELLYKPKDIDFMWCSPVDLHDPSKYITTTASSLHNYLDHNFGGWQEIFPNGGPECTYKGCQLGMHGEASILPWNYSVITDTEEEIVVKLSVKTVRSPFYLEKTLTLKRNEASVYFYEELTNLANEEMALMWGHHPTLGGGFLDDSCLIKTTAKTVFIYGDEKDFSSQRLGPNSEYQWPHVKDINGKTLDLSKMVGPNSNVADMIFLKDFEDVASYEVINTNKGVSFALEWDGNVMPYLWMWLVAKGSDGYPWYGNTYNLALEPWTSYPGWGLNEAINNNTALKLKANEKIVFNMKMGIELYS